MSRSAPGIPCFDARIALPDGPRPTVAIASIGSGATPAGPATDSEAPPPGTAGNPAEDRLACTQAARDQELASGLEQLAFPDGVPLVERCGAHPHEEP